MFIPITRPLWVARFVLLIGVVLLGFGVYYGSEAALLTFDGAHTTGVVTAKRIDPHYFSSSNGDSSAYFVSFDFTPDGGSAIHSELFVDHDAWNQLEIGGPIAVDYVRLMPAAMNAVATGSAGGLLGVLIVAALALAAGAVFATFGGRFLIGERRQRALVSSLQRDGVRVTGRVIDNDAAELWIRFNLQRRLRYEFTDSTGQRRTGLSDWMPRSSAVAIHRGTEGIVRYDSRDPTRSAWFGAD